MYSFDDIGFHCLGSGRAAEIHRWCKNYQNVCDFKVHITPDYEVIITTKGLLDWDETLHTRFCKEFGLILFKVTSSVSYYKDDYETMIILHYGFVFDEPERFKDYNLEWDEFVIYEPSSLKYDKLKAFEIHENIESLMGEYLQARNDWRCTEEQKEYYDAKLDALYELNRRIL